MSLTIPYRGDPKLIGLGFSVFATIIFVESIGSPLMKSCSVVIGLAVGCIISACTGYWSTSKISQAPIATFPWVHTFKLSVDGTLVLPLLIMFACQAVSCMPDILATAEISGVEIEGTKFNSRIQGGILCDGLGSFISALATGPPMVSQAGNNGVIVLTSCAVSLITSQPVEIELTTQTESTSRLGCLVLSGTNGSFRQVRCSLCQYATKCARRHASISIQHNCSRWSSRSRSYRLDASRPVYPDSLLGYRLHRHRAADLVCSNPDILRQQYESSGP